MNLAAGDLQRRKQTVGAMAKVICQSQDLVVESTRWTLALVVVQHFSLSCEANDWTMSSCTTTVTGNHIWTAGQTGVQDGPGTSLILSNNTFKRLM